MYYHYSKVFIFCSFNCIVIQLIGLRMTVVVIVWCRNLQLLMQSVPISTKLWVRILLRRDVLDTISCDKVYQWFSTSCWFSLDTLVSSINKADGHGIAEILLKVALSTINLTPIWFIICVNCYIINKNGI